MSFSYIAGVWDIYVDDMESVAASGNIGSAISQISTLYAGRLFCDYDGVMFIQNTDSEVHRVKLVPLSDTSFTANTEVNSSYVGHPDGSLTFCLAIGG